MNRYNSNLSALLNTWHKGKNASIDWKALVDTLQRAQGLARSQGNASITQLLNATVIPEGWGGQGQAVINSTSMMMSEAINMLCGVEIQVDDPDFVEAMVRTKVEATLQDVQLPYPVCEFVFPKGIMLDDRYELAGCLIVDRSGLDMWKLWKGKLHEDQIAMLEEDFEDLRAPVEFFVNLIRDGKQIEGTNWLRCSREDDINDLPSDPLVQADENAMMHQHLRAVCALCLFLQSEHANKGLLDVKPIKPRGVCRALGQAMKKRRAKSVRNLLPTAVRESMNQERSVEGRKRMKGGYTSFHARVLRHERYKRNPDGSPVVKFIFPYWAGPAPDEGDRTVRTIKPRKQI
jgi:hypothetical protein